MKAFICISCILLCWISFVSAAERDFYKILGIPRSANEKEIKRAFKKMSLQYHPDKNQGNEDALKKFQDVSAAYEVLSDSEKRRKYD
jgi:DnaJ-class molecular chaperone